MTDGHVMDVYLSADVDGWMDALKNSSYANISNDTSNYEGGGDAMPNTVYTNVYPDNNALVQNAGDRKRTVLYGFTPRFSYHTEPGQDRASHQAIAHKFTGDEAISADRLSELDGDDRASASIGASYSVITELRAIRDALGRLEAIISSGRALSRKKGPQGKRKQTVLESPTKKQKRMCQVNIMATRIVMQSEDAAESWEYIWQRGRRGRCWVRGMEAGGREEVDGGYLLCHASKLSIWVRANADWLLIELQWNDEARVFEGSEVIEGRRLQVEDRVMIDMICGGEGEHVGLIF